MYGSFFIPQDQNEKYRAVLCLLMYFYLTEGKECLDRVFVKIFPPTNSGTSHFIYGLKPKDILKSEKINSSNIIVFVVTDPREYGKFILINFTYLKSKPQKTFLICSCRKITNVQKESFSPFLGQRIGNRNVEIAYRHTEQRCH